MKRLPAIDLHRGVIVILMVMHHTVDAWIRNEDRVGELYKWLRHLGGLPAPGFMFLAGLSGALVLARERQKGAAPKSRVISGLKRGLYVLGIAFAFRIVSFVFGGNPLSNWAMVFRVDILNCMGVSLALLAAASAWAPSGRASATLAGLTGLGFLLAAPLVFGRTLEFPNEIAGNYVAGTGPLVMFPLFPWLFFAATGFVTGESLAATADVRRWGRFALLAGALAIALGWGLGRAPFDVYPAHDYWKCSPLFMLIRVGIQLMLLGTLTEIAEIVRPQTGNDPLQLLGRHSLAVYLVHVEVVYGHLSGPLHGRLGIGTTVAAMTIVNLASWLLAVALERRERRPAPAPAPAEAPNA